APSTALPSGPGAFAGLPGIPTGLAPGRPAGRPLAQVREVGLRDGLQSIAATVPTHHKTAWIAAAHAAGQPAIISRNERGQHRELSWPELRRQVAALALHLRAQGVGPGDRVAAYLPNIPEAMVALLATASLGA
ncbi:AMP-binding protein, partial [Salmonella enterica]